METQLDEIADRIYRMATFVPDIGPSGFTFNSSSSTLTNQPSSTPDRARCSRRCRRPSLR
jgi:hypothetical protein